MTDGGADPYEQLAALLERELELVGDRRLDEMLAVRDVRSGLQDSLPAIPPPSARAALERSLMLHKRVEIELLRVREAILMELAQVQRGQRAARGYAPVRQDGRRVAATA